MQTLIMRDQDFFLNGNNFPSDFFFFFVEGLATANDGIDGADEEAPDELVLLLLGKVDDA